MDRPAPRRLPRSLGMEDEGRPILPTNPCCTPGEDPGAPGSTPNQRMCRSPPHSRSTRGSWTSLKPRLSQRFALDDP